MKVIVKILSVSIVALLGGSLILCFEPLRFLMPFAITLMALGGLGVVACGCAAAIKATAKW